MDEKNGFGISYWKKDDKLFLGFWKNNKKSGFGKFFHGNKVKYGVWEEKEKQRQKVQWFSNDEEALNYLEKNNLERHRQYFEYNKEEIINRLDSYYNENFIAQSLLN